MKVEGKEAEKRLERFKAAARDAGIKLTHQRLEIFRAVASSLEHPDTVNRFGQVVSAHVEVRGICDHCARQPSSSQLTKEDDPSRGRKRSKS